MFEDLVRLSPTLFSLTLIKKDLKASASFKRGAVAVNTTTKTLFLGADRVFSVAVPEPDFFPLATTFQILLIDKATGLTRAEPRSITLVQNQKEPEWLHSPGVPKTVSKHSELDGFYLRTFKFPCWMEHTGVDTSGTNIDHLIQYTSEAFKLRDHMAWMCREARRSCFKPVAEEITAFQEEQLIRPLDAWNASLGRSKDKIPYPRGITSTHPTLGPLYRFLAHIEYLKKEKKPVPQELYDKTKKFVERLKKEIDFEPLNKFRKDFSVVFDQEAEQYRLTRHQKKHLKDSLVKTMANRGKGAHMDKGWPVMRYDYDSNNWSIQVHVDAVDIDVRHLFPDNFTTQGEDGQPVVVKSKKAVSGLSLGNAIDNRLSGHPDMRGEGHPDFAQYGPSLNVKNRQLRKASIRLAMPGGSRKKTKGVPLEELVVDFAVLQKTAFPETCYVKQYTLVRENGNLFLCLSLQMKLQYPLPADFKPIPEDEMGDIGIDLRWRRDLTDPDGMFIVAGVRGTEKLGTRPIQIRLSLTESRGRKPGLALPEGAKDLPLIEKHRVENQLFNSRDTFDVLLGPSRWCRHILSRPRRDAGEATTDEILDFTDSITEQVMPLAQVRERVIHYLTLSEEFPWLDTFEGILHLQARRSQLVQMVKAYTRLGLGSAAPAWVPQAGSTGMARLAREVVSTEVKEVLAHWVGLDAMFGYYYRTFWSRVVLRRRREYERIVNAIYRELQGRVKTVYLEQKFLNKVIERTNKYSDPGLRYSHKYRHWFGLSLLVKAFVDAAPRYGFKVERVLTDYTSCICQFCHALNSKVDGKQAEWTCEKCERINNLINSAAAAIADPALMDKIRKQEAAA